MEKHNVKLQTLNNNLLIIIDRQNEMKMNMNKIGYN